MADKDTVKSTSNEEEDWSTGYTVATNIYICPHKDDQEKDNNKNEIKPRIVPYSESNTSKSDQNTKRIKNLYGF